MMEYFKLNFLLGLRYAFWMILVGAACGALYGAISGILIGPAMFCVLFCGVLAVLNMAVAIVTAAVNGILAIFKKGNRRVTRYLALSVSIGGVYLAIFYIVYLSEAAIF